MRSNGTEHLHIGRSHDGRGLPKVTCFRADDTAAKRWCQAPAMSRWTLVRRSMLSAQSDFALCIARSLAQVRDQQADAVRQLHDFTFPLNIEFNFVVPGSRMIDGFLQAEQRLDHLLRQNEADPHTPDQ